MRTSRLVAVLALTIAAGAVAFTGCSSDDSGSTPPAGTGGSAQDASPKEALVKQVRPDPPVRQERLETLAQPARQAQLAQPARVAPLSSESPTRPSPRSTARRPSTGRSSTGPGS